MTKDRIALMMLSDQIENETLYTVKIGINIFYGIPGNYLLNCLEFDDDPDLIVQYLSSVPCYDNNKVWKIKYPIPRGYELPDEYIKKISTRITLEKLIKDLDTSGANILLGDNKTIVSVVEYIQMILDRKKK